MKLVGGFSGLMADVTLMYQENLFFQFLIVVIGVGAIAVFCWSVFAKMLG